MILGAGAAGLMAAIHAAERGPAGAPAREGPQARRQDPHVRRHPLQHHPRLRQPRRSSRRSAPTASSSTPPSRPSASATRSPSSTARGWPPRSRRRARSSPSATAPWTCSMPCCAGCGAAAPSSPWASRSLEVLPQPGGGFRVVTPVRTVTASKVVITTGRQVVPRLRHHRRRVRVRRRVRPHARPHPAGAGAADRAARLGGRPQGITLPDVGLKVFGTDGEAAGRRAAGRCCSPTSASPARRRST